MNKEKYIGESALNDKPSKKINLMIRNGSITTPKLADGSVTTEKLADGAVSKDKLDPTIHQEITDSVTASNEATEKAKEATVKADQATAAAIAAKEAADTATQLATTATTASVQATEQAKAATTKAEEATTKANEAAQKADDSREQTEQTLGTMQEVIDKTAIKDEEGTLVETPFRYIQNEEFIFAKVDAEDKLLFGIHWDGIPEFGKTSAVEDRLQSQVTLLAERVATIMGDEDTTNVIDTMNELKKFFAETENTETLTSILANLNSLNTKFGEDIKNLQDTKVDKANITQEFGDSKDKVVSQFALPFREIESPEFIKIIVDANDHLLFTINLDGEVDWGKGIPAPIRAKLQEIVKQITKNDSFAKEHLKCNLEHRKISILGDSLSTYQGYNPTGNIVYYPNENNDIDSVEKTWWKKVIMDSNSVLSINESYSGSKISGTDNFSFVNRFKNLGDPQYLIIHGGTNDLWQNVPAGVLHFDSIESELNTEEFADAYDILIRKVVSLYPTTNVLLIIPHCVTESYATIINEIADHYNLFGVVDLRKYEFSTANGHYQTSDMEIVANAVLANLFVNKNILKEKGKSLTEDEINESFKIISNETFVKAVIDSEDRILFGIYRATGKPYFPKNELYHLVKNDEYLIAWVDCEDRIVMGIKEDGYLYMRNKDLENTIEKLNGVSIDVSVLKDITSMFSKQNDDNLLWAETDSEDKVIGYTAKDGSHYLRNLKSETIREEFSDIQSQEDMLEAKTDSEDKIISFRDKSGYLNEMVGIKTNSLLLSEKGFNDFKKALADSGFDNGFANWSSYLSNDGEKPLNLPTPKCAVININTNVEISSLLKMGMDGAKNGVNYNVPAEIEFWDMNGNFFKKPILLTGQGRSSMSQEKKNMSVDLFDSSQYDSKGTLGKGEAFSIKFGDWVAQDGFHLKAYYTDFFRGINNAAYKFWYEIEKTRGFLKDATWKKGLLNDSVLNKDINNLSVQIDNGARCVPDGFPSIVYINGDFYGLYSLNLKKHRDNYNMDKNNSNHVHLDGIVDGSTMWYNLDWTAFEVRNPKFLVYKTAQYDKENGKYTYEYNADIAQAEIAGLSGKETSTVYSSSVSYSKGSLVTVGNKLFMSLTDNNVGNDPSLASYGSKPKDVYKKATEHWIEVTHTNNAKQAVIKLSKAILNIRNSSNQKEEFEKVFDAENLIDYTILMSFTGNKDGNGNNWQWTTWNGGDNWFVNVYDCDSICGGMHTGVYISELSASIIGGSENGNTNDWQPAYYAIQLYKTELKERWNELKDVIVNPQHFISILKKYMNRYPKSAYKEEYSKWINCPCNRDSNINSEYWVSVNKFLGHAPTDSDGALLWNESTAYKAQPASGETNLAYIRDGNSDDYYLVKCIKDCVNQNPIVQEKLYSKYPSVLGQRDSIFKLYTRMSKMYIELDKIINQLK